MKNTPMSRDFSPKTHKALAAKGIKIVNAMAIPASPDDKFFTGRGYGVSDNGTYRVFTHRQIMAIAEKSVEA